MELEHTFRDVDVDDTTWTTRRTLARRLVREWEQERWDTRWDVAPIAPIPFTLEQARTLLPGAHVENSGSALRIWAEVGDGSFSYYFDAKGRTVRVDWDPTADSAAYRFHYQYECSPAPSRAQRPTYAADDPR